MCWICDKHDQSSNLTGTAGAGSLHFAASRQGGGGRDLAPTLGFDHMRDEIWLGGDMAKGSDGLIGTGHVNAPPQVATIIVPDNIGGDTNSTATLTVGGPSVISTTNTIGDFDFYKVTLTAGQSYEIGMYAKDGGPNLVAHGDAFVEIYGASGNLIVSADGGAATLRNSVNSGFDVLLTFTPETSGTYFINARAFDQDPVNGTNGDFVGDYELFARQASANAYKPYYDVDNPLYSLDWGSQVDRTSRNPDGQEGPRVTGNDFTGVGANNFGITGKNVITYYFARQGEVFVNQDPVGDPLGAALTTTVAFGMADWEKAAFRSALSSYEKFADVVFVEVANRNEADFKFITYNGTPNVGILGRMSPPNENQEGQAEFNRNGPGWNEASLVQGGFSNITLIHEVGHGMGMSHPHDNGGRSGIMRGVVADGVAFSYTNGDFDLNQGVYTMMSYESGWEKSPYGQASTQDAFGWEGGPMAFDIAVLQDKYGVNEEWATGDNLYLLKDVNAKGTFYEAIWDAGGNDTIAYSGARNATIDLRAATLKYEAGGGGFMSYAFGIHGGYTIANGVTIENATGGAGADTLTGNEAANILDGGAGADVLTGLGGDDFFVVDDSADVVVEGAGGGRDYVAAKSSWTASAAAQVETISVFSHGALTALNLTGNAFAQDLIGNGGANALDGGGGADRLIGLGGNDFYTIDSADDQVIEYAGEGSDYVATRVSFALAAGAEVETLSAASHAATDAINLTGNGFSQDLIGNSGANSLDGGGGSDRLIGLGGNDFYIIDSADDQVIEYGGEGSDYAAAKVSWTLSAGAEVETVSTFSHAATDAIDLNGNALANTMIGNAGANILNGGGGADRLIGLGGADAFVFNSALGGGNVDQILDHEVGVDKIILDDAVFAGLALGVLSAGAFNIGSTAQDADDRILYDAASGALYFDADGVGGAAAVQFASVSAGLAMTASEFTVI